MKTQLLLFLTFILSFAQTSPLSAEDETLPNVLIIGDSISLAYTPIVANMLKGKAQVVHNPGNSQYTGFGLTEIDKWLGDTKWDVIHFNWGLWDLYGWEYANIERTPKTYGTNLDALVQRLEKTGARLVWATTTPVCPEPEVKCKLVIDSATELAFRNAALKVMKKHGVQVNDLHALIQPDLEQYATGRNNVHFNGEGSKKLASQVADFIKSNLKSELPNVLIVGDSISIGYTPSVIEALKGVANVRRVKGNCGSTQAGIAKLKSRWLGDTKWDVIHFNWGLHDLCYRHPESKVQGNRDKVNGTLSVSLEEYEKNLEILVIQLEETGAKLIWASTTVVPGNEAGRIVGDDIKYNAIAAKVMKKHGIPINDLHALSSSFAGKYSEPGNVHYSKEGSGKLGEQVAGSIRMAIGKNSTQD